MKTGTTKRYGNSAKIEEILVARMEERFRDGNVSEEIADYFLQQHAETEIPLLLCGKKKPRPAACSDAGATAPSGATRRGAAACISMNTAPPFTNRGVTFHDCNDSPEFPHDNVPPSDLQQTCPRIMGGYDGGVTIGFEGTWDENRAATFAILETAKQNAQNEENPQQEFELDGRMYVMLGGGRLGGSQGPCYSYIFVGSGVKFYIHRNAKGGIQPVRIVYMAESLIGRDLFHVHYRTLGILGEMGFHVTEEKLSRVDMQVMIPLRIEEVLGVEDKSRVVCSAQKDHFHRRSGILETYTIGNINTVELCIYDKRAEMMKLMKSNPVKFALMIQECFGEDWIHDESPVTRIEFRLGRDILKSMNINSMNDLLEVEAGLARYCCNSWFRILETEKRRGHSHEQAVSKSWKLVQQEFEKWFPGVEGHRREPVRTYRTEIRCDAGHLIKQAVGCLATASALVGGMEANLRETVMYSLTQVKKNSERIFMKAKERAILLGIRTGIVDSEDYRYVCDLKESVLNGLRNAMAKISPEVWFG